MATGKTIPSGFCSDGLGDEELQDERMILPKTTNKRPLDYLRHSAPLLGGELEKYNLNIYLNN